MKLLLVEDNAALAANIGDYLSLHGHSVDFAGDGLLGRQLALSQYYDVIILDVTLPQRSGLDVCADLRRQADRHVPVLMLTARDTLHDKLAGFDHGADDYLTKPFALEELLARCQALSGRHRIQQPRELRIGSLCIDRQQQTAQRGDKPLRLQQIGYQILLMLAEAHPRVVTRSELTDRIWGDDAPDSDALRSHLYLLRQQLDKGFDTPMLITVHGVGYRLDNGS